MRKPSLFSAHWQRPIASTEALNRAGFTLIELVVVLGIILLMLGFAAPGIVGILRGKKVEQALSTVSDVLERTRMEAMTQNTYLWAGLANVPRSASTSGQDELWVITFKGKNGENRIPTDEQSVLPASALRRVEGVSLIVKDKLPERVSTLFPSTAKDFAAETVSATPLKWAGASAKGAMSFERLILFTPRGEAILENGTPEMGVPDPYLWLGLSKTVGGEVAPAEKDMAAVLISGFSGRVTLVRP